MIQDPYIVIGMNGSPYSLKLRAIMRYRRLPFVWELGMPRIGGRKIDVRPPLIPILRLPEDGSYHVDTTPLAHMLEERHPGERSILPQDAGLRFVGDLIEDMADEWFTKMMFHYRWAFDEDIEYCGRWLAGERGAVGGTDGLGDAAMIAERQIGRMPLVGCTPENAPIIETGFERVLDVMERHLADQPYLLGTRPSLADFAIYGQFMQLATDPVPAAIMRRRAQGFHDWLRRLDDASGVDGAWPAPATPLPPTVVELLTMAGDTYLPFLDANARALDQGAETLSLELHGRTYTQATFKYQAKCRDRLRAHYGGLDAAARRGLEGVLAETGCLAYLDGG